MGNYLKKLIDLNYFGLQKILFFGMFCFLSFSAINQLVLAKNKKIFIFYHIACLKNYKEIISSQIDKILISGLYNEVDAIWCFLVGDDQSEIDQCVNLIKNSGRKFKIAAIGHTDKTFERFTLKKIKDYVKLGDKFLYIHSKGIGRQGDAKAHVLTWRNYLEYFVIGQYKTCIKKLDQHDVVGAEYVPWDNQAHFRGNFWWCNASYYFKLPDQIGPNYIDPELYIGLANPKYKNLWDTHGCHFYDESYQPKEYVDDKKIILFKKSKKAANFKRFIASCFRSTLKFLECS